MQERIRKAREAYNKVHRHIHDDNDPTPLPEDDELRLAEGYAMIVEDPAVESLARNVREVRARDKRGEGKD